MNLWKTDEDKIKISVLTSVSHYTKINEKTKRLT